MQPIYLFLYLNNLLNQIHLQDGPIRHIKIISTAGQFIVYFIFVFKNLNIFFLQFFYVKKTYYTGSNANIIKMYIDKLTSNSILQPIYDTLTRYTCQINYQVESFKTLMQTDQTDTNKKRKHPSVANCNLQVQ